MKISQNHKIIVKSILSVYLQACAGLAVVCVAVAIVYGASWLMENHRVVFFVIMAISIITALGYKEGLREINQNKEQSKSVEQTNDSHNQ